MSDETTESLFTVTEVARLFDLHESRIRYWAQTGFINPSGAQAGRRLYTFSDLVGVKAAKELLDRGIPLQRVRRNLAALRAARPNIDQPLGKLRVCSDGETLVVAEEEGAFEPVTGQLLLDFEVTDFRKEVAQLLRLNRPDAARPTAPPPPGASNGAITAVPAAPAPRPSEPPGQAPDSAYGWFLRGCALDGQEEETAQAIEAYEQAIALDPSLAPAYTNLGNLYYRSSNRGEALRCYQHACELAPDQPEARFNLANIYEELGELDQAIAEHRRALSAEPDFIDAHYNLALVLEQVGSRVQALHHWRRFLELVDSGQVEVESTWVEVARDHAAQLSAM